MSTFLTNLQNNEAVLLMYLANELPAEDRAEVEEMLTSDAQLRAMYESMRGAYDSLDSAFGRAEATLRIGSSFSAARSFGDTIRGRNKAVASIDDHHETPRRFRWFIYPSAAAAVLGIGMLIWWQTATKQDNRDIANSYYPDWQRERDPADQAYLAIWDATPPERVQIEVWQELQIVNYLRDNATW